MKRPVTIIGIGDNGCVGLTSVAMHAISEAQILAGGERHLVFFPDFAGKKITVKTELTKTIEELSELANENNVVILASGDPLFFGIGSLVIKKLGESQVRVIPHPSSMQIAFSRANIKWDDASWISLHGKPIEGLMTRLKRISKVAILTDGVNTPPTIASYLLKFGETGWNAWVCENLESEEEKISSFSSLEDLSTTKDISPLNVLILQRNDINWKPLPVIVNQHEDQFAKRVPKLGLITKKEVRMLSIGELGLRRDSILWDIGAASGSIAIEGAMLADLGKAYAIEVDTESVSFCKENIIHFAIDNVHVIEGRAPEILSEIKDDPDAVFIGGSKGSLKEIIEVCYSRLKSGGRIVVNAITFENIQEAYDTFKSMKIDANITMVNISRAVPLARFMRYEAQNPIHIFSAQKGSS